MESLPARSNLIGVPLDTIRRFLDAFGIRGRIAVAVSGGVDSTALLVALHELRADIVAVHVNHHLRGAESDADEAFVRELCARLDVPLRVHDGTLDAEAVKARGIEAAAREVRYAKLQDAADYVATAHQQNDQAETILMRLLTGGGIAALRGIHPLRADGFIRPLLDVTRAEIEAFLRDRDITPRFDQSNDDPRFLRNRVRTFLADVDPAHLAEVAVQARDQWEILERVIDDAEHVTVTDTETRFDSWPENAWLRQALLHRHILRLDPRARLSSRDLERLARATKRTSVTKNLELIGNTLRIKPRKTPPFEVELTPERPAFIDALGKTIRIGAPDGNGQRIELPPGATPRFVVRNRREGDRFQPLGLARAKKLKDFLIDRKIAADLRDRLPLLLWNDEIVWVAGVEVSERFKVTGRAEGAQYEVWMG